MSNRLISKLVKNAVAGTFALGLAASIAIVPLNTGETTWAAGISQTNTNKYTITKTSQGSYKLSLDFADNLKGKRVVLKTAQVVKGKRVIVTLGTVLLGNKGKATFTTARKLAVGLNLVAQVGGKTIFEKKISSIIAAPASNGGLVKPKPTPSVTPSPISEPIAGGSSSSGSAPQTVAASSLDIPCTITGTAGDDVLTGTDGDDVICGLAGNDTISGGLGDDVLKGGAGNDSLSGGQGSDTISYSDQTGAVSVNLATGTGASRSESVTVASVLHRAIVSVRNFIGDVFGIPSSMRTAAVEDTIGVDSISEIENVTGTSADDYIVGSSLANAISSGVGRDTIQAGSGDDTIYGGAGDDTITGEAGTDLIYGGSGTDSIDGGIGNDKLAGGSGTDVVTGGIGENICAASQDDTETGCTTYVAFDVGISRIVSGTIATHLGVPLPDVYVNLSGVGSSFGQSGYSSSDIQGQFKFVVADGEYALNLGLSQVTGQGPTFPVNLAFAGEIEIAANRVLDLRLPAPTTAAITVTDENSVPVQGVRMVRYGGYSGESVVLGSGISFIPKNFIGFTESNADGLMNFSSYGVSTSVERLRYKPGAIGFTAPLDFTQSTIVFDTNVSTLSGSLKFQNGNPVADTRIVFSDATETNQVVTTDINGEFSVNLGQENYDVYIINDPGWAGPPGWPANGGRFVGKYSVNGVVTLDIVLPDSVLTFIDVKDQAGNAIEGANIVADWFYSETFAGFQGLNLKAESAIGSSASNANGRMRMYSFGTVAQGQTATVRVVLQGKTYETFIDPSNPPESITFDLEEKTIQGRFLLPDGTPLVDAEIDVFPVSSSSGIVKTFSTNSTGAFAINAPSGTYKVRIRFSRAQNPNRTFPQYGFFLGELVISQSKTLNLTMPVVTTTVKFKDSEGTPIQGIAAGTMNSSVGSPVVIGDGLTVTPTGMISWGSSDANGNIVFITYGIADGLVTKRMAYGVEGVYYYVNVPIVQGTVTAIVGK